MRGLFLKIFAIFWLAQSLIYIISTALIVSQRFPNHNSVGDALDSHLKNDSRIALSAFEEAGCAGFTNNTARNEPAGAALLDAKGNLVCSTTKAISLGRVKPHSRERIDGRALDKSYVWFVPVTSSSGEKYEYVWFQPLWTARPPSPWHDILHFAFPQIPVALAVGGLSTFVLVLLFTRPLVRLRKAARELAQGNLSARVQQVAPPASGKHADEFQGLAHDFNHMAERLESLVAAQRLLLRDVSHELRSPLARLSVALELAREDSEPALEEHLSRIEREAERLNLLIGQLLTLSSLEATERTSTFEVLSLNELCEQILPDAEYEAQKRPCFVHLEQSGACKMRGDRELLHRAIENVVRNAIRYTEAGSEVTIRVADAPIADNPKHAPHMVMVEVSDRGPGIPEAELEHIFRPFYRVDMARSTSTGGFGVGLAITERAVRLHGGTLQAINRLGGGTSIQLLFPSATKTVTQHS
jgi:two-component system sensor histidine kinase CpxA